MGDNVTDRRMPAKTCWRVVRPKLADELSGPAELPHGATDLYGRRDRIFPRRDRGNCAVVGIG